MHPYIRSGLMAVGVAGALGLLALGFTVSESGEKELPTAVQSITPSEGALISPQGSVGADLADDHTGVLVIDGTEVPLDQLTIVEPLGQVYFRPGEGLSLSAFEAGTHRVSVVYWPKAQSREESSAFTWQFRVGS